MLQGGPAWEWGSPSSGPGAAASGSGCLATNLDSWYPNLAYEICYTTPIDLSAAQAPVLTFRHWYKLEDMYDGGFVSATAGSSAPVLDPGTGYPTLWVDGLSGRRGFSGDAMAWADAWFDLSVLAGRSDVRIVFSFGSDSDVQFDGWFLDDIVVAEAPVVASLLGPARLAQAGGSGTLVLAEDFEAAPASQLTPSLGSSSQWELGAPQGKFLSWVPQGASIAGTRLAADYADNVDADRLLTPFLDFAGATGATLRFAHYYYRENRYDGGRVLASADGVTFVALDPIGGYPYSDVEALSGAGYSGNSVGWRSSTVDLTPLLTSLGTRFQLAFEFASDHSMTYDGWALDEIRVLKH